MLIFFGSSVYNQSCALDNKQNMTSIFVTDLVVIPVKELLSKHVNT